MDRREVIIRFASKVNNYGWRHQLEVNLSKREFKFGSFLFNSADVSQLTKKQLVELEQVLLSNDFRKVA